ncbi:hypothetical protein niasHT_018235 [Heterodera trifolii]|uniref:MATH domain-containing protein n=1 Tax=Heterodera trifolii TaxID=157864 RepID=A0ABD2KUK5_9BILA
MLGSALFKIRLPLLAHNEFTAQIVPSGILIAEEEVGIKQYRSQSKMCGGTSEGLLYGPLQFPSHWRNLTFGTIVMDIENVSEFAREKVGSRRFSKTVQIRGLPWKMMAKIDAKIGKTDEKLLGFYIKCAAPKEDKNWNCECSAATFRIISKIFDVQNSTGRLFGKIFNHTADQAGFTDFISFSELLYPDNGFYNRDEDKVTLTVDFILKNAEMGQFSAPKTSDKTIFMEIEKVFEFFCEIIGSERKSETVHIKGLPWKIIAKINADNQDIEKTFGFYLFCAVPKETPNWSRKCSATFRIVSGDHRIWFEGRTFSNEKPIHGFDNFVRFSYLQSDFGGYDMEEDKVTLAIDIYVDDEKRERPDNSIFG